MPRESGASSTPRLFDSIAGVSGILDHPLSRMMTAAGYAADSNFQTAALSKEHTFAFSPRISRESCFNLRP
jgi:hypothetical protein